MAPGNWKRLCSVCQVVKGKAGAVAVILLLFGIAVIGWWRVASVSADLKKAHSERDAQQKKATHLADQIQRMGDELLQIENALARSRRRARKAALQTHTMEDCVGIVADENGVGSRTVVFGFLRLGEGSELLVDEAQWYTGDDANREARHDGVIGPRERIPNDYYIRNDDRSRTSLLVAEDVVIVTTTADRHNIPSPKCTTWSQFAAALRDPKPWEASLNHSPYWLTVRSEQVMRIVEQYLP